MSKKKERKKNWYWLTVIIISITVSILVHLPELMDLTGRIKRHSIFPGIRPVEVLDEIFFSFLSLLILFVVNTFVFRFNRTKEKMNLAKIILSFIVCMTVSTIISNLFYYIHFQFNLPSIQATLHHYLHPIRDFINASVATGTCVIIYLIGRGQRIAVENQSLRAENIQCQYDSLKKQLNPHMLFNSLNTLQSLIRESSPNALLFTDELSNTLRYTLQDGEEKNVCLKEEMEFVRSYTYLLEMRYEDNLVFDIRIDEKYLYYLLPPMSVQMLIENAVKHNEISSRHPLKISICTNEKSQLIVYNKLQPRLDINTSTGIGLNNLSQRYFLLYGEEIEILTDSGNFCVKLPLIYDKDYEDSNYRR